jgi:hypothetical protein
LFLLQDNVVSEFAVVFHEFNKSKNSGANNVNIIAITATQVTIFLLFIVYLLISSSKAFRVYVNFLRIQVEFYTGSSGIEIGFKNC